MFSTKNKVLSLLFITALSLFTYHQASYESNPIQTSRLLTSTYATTTTRTKSVDTFCAGKQRNQLIDADQTSLYKFFSQQMKESFPIDGNGLIVNAINSNFGQAQSTIQSNIKSFATFIGPFALGLVLILTISPFLLCCCVCPGCCPSKCCRKSQEELYTPFELYWPTVCLIVALLIAMGACIAGFANSESIAKNIDSNLCSISIILDDLRNGNVTNSGSSFFAGLTQIKTQVGYLSGNLSSINTTMASIIPTSGNISTTTTRGNTALTDIQKIPKNTNAGGNMANIAYNTPFTSASPSSTINSIFPTVLGSSNTGGLIQTFYKIIEASLTTIQSISQSALHFNNEASNFQSGVSALQTLIQQFNDFLVSSDNNLYNILVKVFENKSTVVLAVKLVYGVTIGIASLMLLGTLMVAFCGKASCRYLMYFACVFLFIIGVAGFLLSLGFSIMTPATYFGCQFISHSLSSASNFNNNFNKTITDATFRNYITTCLPSSSGDLLTTFGGTTVNALQNFSNSVTKMYNFNISQEATLLTTGMSALKTTISNYEKGNIIDITDTTNINFLKTLSTPGSYSSCAATGFTSDSWIPSTAQNPNYIPCTVSGGNAVSTSCTSSFTTRGGSCNGCMDTTSVLSSYTAKASLLSDLNSRYSGCTNFNNDLSNTWDNYYKIKKNSFSPITTRVNTAEASVTTYANTITSTIQPTFTNAINALKAASATVTDPQYGLVAGLNCKLIGEDIQRTFDTFCQSLFTVTFFTRLVMGLTSFGILFSLCCGVCTGIRFMKQQIRKLNSAGNVGLDDEAVQEITDNNFVIPKVLQ